MDYREMIGQMRSGKLQGNYLISVEEEYLYDLFIEALTEDFLGGRLLDFNFEEMDFLKRTPDEILNALETLPMMAEKRIVLIDHMPLERDSVKQYTAALEPLIAYLENPNPSTLGFFIFRGKKPFQGKFVKKADSFWTRVSFDRLKKGELMAFIAGRFQLAGIRVNRKIPEILARESGYLERDSQKNLYDVQNEADKIASSYKGKGTLDEETLEALLVLNYDENIFAYTDALGERRVDDALKLFDGFQKMNLDSYRTYYMTVRLIRNLLNVKACLLEGYTEAKIISRIKLSPFEFKKVRGMVRRFSLEELKDLHARAYDFEKRMKTESFDMDLELPLLILRFAEKKK